MSYDVYAQVIRGVRVRTDALYTNRKKRGCDHIHYGKFCSKCGAPMWIGEDIPIAGYDGFGKYGDFTVIGDGDCSYVGELLLGPLYDRDVEKLPDARLSLSSLESLFSETAETYVIVAGG